MTEADYKAGFNAGYSQLQLKDSVAATDELWEALGINNRESFRFYRIGQIECKVSQAVAVEEVFRKYGITENIWGKCESMQDLRSVSQK